MRSEMKYDRSSFLCGKCNQNFENANYYWHPLKDNIYCEPCFPKTITWEERAKGQWAFDHLRYTSSKFSLND